MSKRERGAFVPVLETLKAGGCIAAYSIEGTRVVVRWNEGGFDRAFAELKANLKPFGLKSRQRGALLVLLSDEDKKAVSDWMEGEIRDEYGI